MSENKENLSNFFKKYYNGIPEFAKESLSKVTSLFDKLRGKYFCIGITELSHSGKPTFIARLISQLLPHEKACLSKFPPTLSERLLNLKIHPLEDKAMMPFPYNE